MPEPRPVPALALLRPAPADAPIESRDDDALMVLTAGGHRKAFEVLVGRYLAPLTSYCTKFLGSGRCGEEVAQDVLLEVWSQRSRYRSGGKFQVYLFTVGRHRCLNRARDDRRRSLLHAAARRETTPEEVASAPAGPDQLDTLLERERQRRTRLALLELTPKLREVVLLRFDQGLEYAEIARIVGRVEVTVRSRVFHALRRLRQLLGGEDAP